MSSLVFVDWNSPDQTFDFVGWKSGRAESAFLDSSAYVLDATGHRKALQLRLPFLVPASYQRDPFPDHPPSRIEKFRLLPPPCRSTEREAKALLDFAQYGWKAALTDTETFTVPMDWEAVFGEVVYPTSADDDELRQRLKELKASHRAEYRARKAALANRTDPEAANDAVMLEQLYRAPAKRLYSHGPMTAGHLNVTLAMVKQGGPLLERFLHGKWAIAHRFDLDEMKKDGKLFLRRWNELTTAIVHSTPTGGGGRLSTKIQNWTGWHDKEQQLQALVIYRIHFADGARFWLSGCQLRALTTTEENREFDELLSTRSPVADPTSHSLSPPFLSLEYAANLTQRGERWLRNECKSRGWKISELDLAKVVILQKEAKNRKEKLRRVMRHMNKSKKFKTPS